MKLRAKRTYIAVLAVLVLAGGGSLAYANHQADKNQAAEARADAKAARDAKAKAAANKAAELEHVAAETKAFCVLKQPLSAFDNKALRVSVEKSCPGVVRANKLKRARLAAEQAAKRDAAKRGAAATPDAAATPNGFIGSDPYCYSRYEVAIAGNGPGSPYSDYTDEDIARSEAEFNEYCANYDPNK